VELNKLYNGKKVLITGHTGFKGSWLCAWLHSLGASVSGVALAPPSSPSHFDVAGLGSMIVDYRIDIRDADAIKKIVCEIQPDFVFHLSAQALVRPSYASPLETMTINAIGSANVLDALRQLEKQVVAVMITSDKAYDNVEWVWGYREADRLGGKDPYSASKGMAELAIHSYVESFFNEKDTNIRVGITRAGNVIGGGDWAVDRIVPDCMHSWSQGEVVEIRRPQDTRPWQHVLEPLSGYLQLGANLYQDITNHGEAYNFGPPADQNYSVRELIDEMSKYWDRVRWKDISQYKKHLHEAGLLKLNCDKALADLNWKPTLKFEETVKMTVKWYRYYYENSQKSNPRSVYDYTLSQIEGYSHLAEQRKMSWAV
jgi:CDP-glucose 4,6-dehydratase